MMVKIDRFLALTCAFALVAVCFSSVACDSASALFPRPSGTATVTATPTATATATSTATSTATPTPTLSATPTAEPLHVSLTLDPPQVRQGNTLLVEVRANRPITAAGTLDERALSFLPDAGRTWAVVGIPVTADVTAHPVQLTVADDLGRSVSTTVAVMVVAGDFGSEHIDVPADRVALLEPAIVAKEAAHIGEVFAQVAMQRLWEGTFIWPLAGQVTAPFGIRRTYNSGQPSYHGGLDISGDLGAPVVAANQGIVALAEPLDVRGDVVILDHGWGVYSGYYHLSEILVTEGQKVAQGELIGRVGNTGLSTGAHLHWEMRVGGVLVNPLEWTARRIPE